MEEKDTRGFGDYFLQHSISAGNNKRIEYTERHPGSTIGCPKCNRIRKNYDSFEVQEGITFLSTALIVGAVLLFCLYLVRGQIIHF